MLSKENPVDSRRYGHKSNDSLGAVSSFGLYRDSDARICDLTEQDGFSSSFFDIDFLSIRYWEHATWPENIQLPQAASEILSVDTALADVVMSLQPYHMRNSSVATPDSLLDSAQLIFAPGRVDTFVQSYFVTWHRHCPVLHQPSFDASVASPPLLAAVVLIGATYSSRKYAKAARNCLDAMEAHVFDHEAFRQLVNPASSKSATPGIAPLQAAFLVTVLQNWDNHRGSRRRMRLQRYADLVSAARHLGLPSLRHPTSRAAGMPSSSQDWEAFVKVEEAIR